DHAGIRPRVRAVMPPRAHDAVRAGGVPAAVAVADPQRCQRPEPRGVWPVALRREAGGQQVHDGATGEVMLHDVARAAGNLAHLPASCPGTGLLGGSTPAACSAATM